MTEGVILTMVQSYFNGWMILKVQLTAAVQYLKRIGRKTIYFEAEHED